MGRSKKKSTNEAPLGLNNEMYFNLEIDMQAIRGKNQELVETVAKIQKEKSLLQKQINLLQKDYFALNSKYVNLKNLLSTVDSTANLCFPKVAEVVNQVAKIIRVCSVGVAISNTGDQKTQEVRPHRVNGTVIKSPTITISRFSDSPRLSNGGPSPTSQTSRSINNNQETEPIPSTSRGFSERLSFNQNDENDVFNRENEGTSNDFVNRNRRGAVPLSPLNIEEEEETENENNLEEAEQNIENGEYCSRLVTIEEESDDDYLNSSPTNSQLTEETIREIRIYLSPLRGAQKEDQTSLNNSLEHFSYRTSSLSAEASNTINENTFVDEIRGSPNKSTRLSGPNKTNNKSPTFFLEDSNWKNNGNNSYTFTNISAIPKSPSAQDSEPSCSNTSDISKILTMESLGLTTTIAHQLATSTPVVSTPRMSSRLKKSSSTKSTKNETVCQNSKQSITKRKTSMEPNVAQVLIKRLDLDKSNASMHEVSKRLNATPITSPKSVKPKRRRIISPSSSSSESSLAAEKSPVTKMKKKGKENKKVLETSVHVTKSSPRPKRNARPGSMREPSLNKKMRRSR